MLPAFCRIDADIGVCGAIPGEGTLAGVNTGLNALGVSGKVCRLSSSPVEGVAAWASSDTVVTVML